MQPLAECREPGIRIANTYDESDAWNLLRLLRISKCAKTKEHDDKREVKDMLADSGPLATDNSH